MDLTWHIGRAEYGALVWAAQRAARARLSEVVVFGVKVPVFVREGEGIPVVFVHGFAADKESWLLLARLLDKRRAFVIPDLPGFGAAGEIPPERASARAQSHALLAILDALGHPRAHLVGSSMGGGIALRTAVDAQERVASLILVGSVGPVVQPNELTRELDAARHPLVLDS